MHHKAQRHHKKVPTQNPPELPLVPLGWHYLICENKQDHTTKD